MRLDHTEALDDFQLLTDTIYCNCENDNPNCPDCFGENWKEDLPTNE